MQQAEKRLLNRVRNICTHSSHWIKVNLSQLSLAAVRAKEFKRLEQHSINIHSISNKPYDTRNVRKLKWTQKEIVMMTQHIYHV